MESNIMSSDGARMPDKTEGYQKLRFLFFLINYAFYQRLPES
jgi:hypothetical protein